MTETDEMLRLGAFEPPDAKRLLSMLEALGIAFQVEADDSAMFLPGREFEMFWGMYPRGSQVVIRVRESDLSAGRELIRSMYPVECEPAK